MGATLPRPVTPVVVKRLGGSQFRVGFAEMNGLRKNMEDAHVIFCKDTWGFFGVFDGHGGDQCSKFIAKRLYEELEAGPPADDKAMKDLMLRLDQEFLDTKQASGSTGTFTLVTPPAADAGKYVLRVGNIGDSRVLLGRSDGTMVEGQGTDGGLTTDHKPDHPSEKARIERTGGYVEMVQGVARVNGDLAVSRSFGDAQYKQTGGPEPEEHPVSAGPELLTVECDATDFLVLVCDGISEVGFPNREVIKLAADELFGKEKPPDAGRAATAVVQQALASGSCDNLSCMIVLLGGGDAGSPELTLVPGPYDAPTHGGFKKAYEAMAEHAGFTLPQAVEMRYDTARQELAMAEDGPKKALESELACFGDGPAASLAVGSAERTAWFAEWINSHKVEQDPDFASLNREQLLGLCLRRPDLMAMARAHGLMPEEQGQNVRVGPVKEVRAAVRRCPTLKWTDKLRSACGKIGTVVAVDPSDDTAQVRIAQLGLVAWLPMSVLVEVDEDEDDSVKQRCARLAPVEEVKPAVDAHPNLSWNDRFAEACGRVGRVLRDDESDGTSKVRFPEPVNFVAWFPSSALTQVPDEEEADDKAGDKGGAKDDNDDEGEEDEEQRDGEDSTKDGASSAGEGDVSVAQDESNGDGSVGPAESNGDGSAAPEESNGDPEAKRRRLAE